MNCISTTCSKPLLTVAIPTYNGSKTIFRMLDLLLAQCDSRVEVLISDNCSTDGTQKLLQKYFDRYPLIRYVRNDRNIGPDGNFLQCMQLSNGSFTYLISDDDVLTEDSLPHILDYLTIHPYLSLAYLYTEGFYGEYVIKERCVQDSKPVVHDLYAIDKKTFFDYASHYWGFMSSFLWSTDKFRSIEQPERFFGTFWLQSYIHILCANGEDAKLGVISGPCVAAGIYMNMPNLDVALVDGIYYRKMLDFAVESGFDSKQLNDWYIRRLCLIASHSLVKEKAAGLRMINRRQLFMCSWRFPQAWIKIYPFFFVPKFVCVFVAKSLRKKRGKSGNVEINRLD